MFMDRDVLIDALRAEGAWNAIRVIVSKDEDQSFYNEFSDLIHRLEQDRSGPNHNYNAVAGRLKDLDAAVTVYLTQDYSKQYKGIK